jgi:sarcosine oxidase subunit alpha
MLKGLVKSILGTYTSSTSFKADMTEYRIQKHPILSPKPDNPIEFSWQGRPLMGQSDETIASALFANGIHVFGHHHKDGSPQGIFCANGQCSQCMVLANSYPVKACMEILQPGMKVEALNGLPVLPETGNLLQTREIQELEIPVLIIGGGPSGLSAAIELAKAGIQTMLIDDKHRLGGKLVLQTHRFFGSVSTVYAGTRGIDIATRLEKQVKELDTITVWLNSTALAIFSDQKVGVLKEGNEYVLIKPEVLLVASGAREKSLAFTGNTLPGVYGAGAFQTLVNRDLVKPAEKLFIVGGGNVGLIAGYHALQAGIEVAGLVEALPECGGYKVHKDKLVRMGVPIYTSHTILSANGKEQVESITIAAVDQHFQPQARTERSFACDTILIAVGLDPVNEFYMKAKEFGLKAFACGDAEEIAEASAAIFSGKIRGREIVNEFGRQKLEVPPAWYQLGEILKSKPGQATAEELPEYEDGVFPVIHCTQEIPCDPCSAICPQGLIHIEETDIRKTPVFLGDNYCCGVCEQCVSICPGLAITLVDYRNNPDLPVVSIPFEYPRERLPADRKVVVTDTQGNDLGEVIVIDIDSIPTSDRTLIVRVEAPKAIARKIAGIQVQEKPVTQPMDLYVKNLSDEIIICRCERVTAGEIRALIKQGIRDLNEIKTITRAGMGACGSKTCNALIYRLFRDEGIPVSELTDQTKRPVFIEVPAGVFAGIKSGGDHD